MKKKIFSKLLMCLLVLTCAFVVSACGSIFQKEGTNIESIEILTNSVPEAIVVGKFDDAQIKAKVTYDDGTNETITITTEMIPEEYRNLLNTPGIYEVTIAFRGETTKVGVRMVNSLNLYQVSFYDHNEKLITTQFVYDGEDATPPSDFMVQQHGWAFLGWDRSYENISEDTNIYASYINIENTLSDAKMEQALLKAEQYYITNNHYVSVEEVSIQGELKHNGKTTINYHYDSEKQVATSQSVYLSEDTKMISVFGETEAESLYYSTVEGNDYYKITYEDYKTDWDEEDEGISFEQMLQMSKLYGGTSGFHTSYHLTEGEVEYGYEISQNKLIYTCTIAEESVEDIYRYVDTCIVKYDDEKILQIIESHASYDGDEIMYSYTKTFNIDYTTIAFNENLIPDFGDINGDNNIDETDANIVKQYLAKQTTLTEEQLILADVNLDDKVTEYDYQLFELFLNNKIPHLPLSEEFIIDELFDNAIETGLSGDVTLTMVGKWADDGDVEDTTTIAQIDRENKVVKIDGGEDELGYIWESEGALYEAFDDGEAMDCDKTTSITFEQYMGAESIYMFIGYQMIYGGAYDETEYEFGGIGFDEDDNFVLTINASKIDYPEITGTIKYTFNTEHILSIESTYDFIGTYTYDYSDVTLNLPEDVKALESSATEW